jgi:pantothenate kinase
MDADRLLVGVSQGFVSCLKKIVDEGTAKCPCFDHAAGDPVEDAIVVNSSHSIVIVEGNYLLLGFAPSRQSCMCYTLLGVYWKKLAWK